MTANNKSTVKSCCLVAIDVAKNKHLAFVERPDGTRKKVIFENSRGGFEMLWAQITKVASHATIALEPTADYHRGIAYFLQVKGADVHLVSSIAVARTREALHNSWDKNDPKDAQVILHLLKAGHSKPFYDPVLENTNDWQELSKTHFQVSLRKTRIQHSILNHFLPIYFPEAEQFMTSHRAHWFAAHLMHYPTPSCITQLSREAFIEQASPVMATKRKKSELLGQLYDTAKDSIGIPISPDSQAVAMMKLIAGEYLALLTKRREIEVLADTSLADLDDYRRLRTVPGIGPIIALTILSEAGNIRRFGHEKQFLKFCGLDLSTQTSGTMRGRSKLSKRGNCRLRAAFWMAGRIAVRMRENSFQRKFARYTKHDPHDADVKRRAYTATMAKMARVAYGIIKNSTDYRSFHKEPVTSG